MTKYRATLVNVRDLPKPVVHYGNFLEEINQWITLTLAKYPPDKYPQAQVDVYVVTETFLDSIGHATVGKLK
jgi:hypothetical protein